MKLGVLSCDSEQVTTHCCQLQPFIKLYYFLLYFTTKVAKWTVLTWLTWWWAGMLISSSILTKTKRWNKSISRGTNRASECCYDRNWAPSQHFVFSPCTNWNIWLWLTVSPNKASDFQAAEVFLHLLNIYIDVDGGSSASICAEPPSPEIKHN